MATHQIAFAVGNNGTGTTLAASAIASTTGYAIICGGTHEVSAGTMSVADTPTNSYTGLTNRAHANGDQWGQIFYAKNITGHASNVITLTTPSVAYRGFSGNEVSGLDTTAPFDVEGWAEVASNTVVTTPSMTAAGAGYIFAIAKAYNSSSWTLGASMTGLQQVEVADKLHGSEYRIIGAGGGYTPSITRGAATALMIVAAIFKDTGGGGGGATQPSIMLLGCGV